MKEHPQVVIPNITLTLQDIKVWNGLPKQGVAGLRKETLLLSSHSKRVDLLDIGYKQFTKRIEQIEHKLSNLEKKTAPPAKEEVPYPIGPGSGSSYKSYTQPLSKTQNLDPPFEKPSQMTKPPVPLQQEVKPTPQPAVPTQTEKRPLFESTNVQEHKNTPPNLDTEPHTGLGELDLEVSQAEKERRERRERMERIERLIAREQAQSTAATNPEVGQGTGGSVPHTPAPNAAGKAIATISPEKVPGPFRSLIENAR